MSRQINQPSNQVKLTNVSVVRCNKAGKRFEIACYRNKVMDYRAGLEKDLSEVLQTDRIFTNVSKGKFANKADLEMAFGTRDEVAICHLILNNETTSHHHHHNDGTTGGTTTTTGGHGSSSVQVSDLERQQQLQNTTSQIATWVASNCVHPDTGRPYTVSQIKHALGKNYTVHHSHKKAIKKQYLDCVKFLKTIIPIERAKMELTLEFPFEHEKKADIVQPVLQRLPHVRVNAPENTTTMNHRNNNSNNNNNNNDAANNNNDTTTTKRTICVQVDPSHYRELDELMKRVGGRLEIVQQVVAQKEGDVDLEVQVLKRNKQQQQQQQQQQQSSDSNEPKLPGTAAALKVDNNNNNDLDEEGARLMKKLEKVRLQAASGGGGGGDNKDNDNDKDSDSDHQPVNKKSLRKAQKKNKKAKQKHAAAARLEEEQESSLIHDDENHDASPSAAVAAAKDKANDDVTAVQQQEQNQTSISEAVAGAADNGGANKSCNTCGGTFANAAQHRAHFRSDWHRFNQKLKLKGIAAVSEQEFLLCDAEEFFGGSTN